ncbi:MAG: tetratricopeptide repeat protein [Pseudomonadota bacterium]
MKRIAGLITLALLLAGPAGAQAPANESVRPAPEARAGEKGDRRDRVTTTEVERNAARLDLMFGRLAKATTKRRADRIARHIMRRMNRSGSDTVDLLMLQAGEAMRVKNYAIALDLLDGVVRLRPEFAEGWNRRATVHFMNGSYGRSLADIEQVLRREPRHWGALAGMAMILMAIDKKKDALAVMDRALAVHPHLEQLRERRDRLVIEVQEAET